MKKILSLAAILFALNTASFAQNEKKEAEGKEKITVPAAVKEALTKKYPKAAKVSWEKEKGNYEANWGGKSGEDNSVQFTPSGNLIEIVHAISISELPKPVISYVKEHYNGARITEAGKVTDALGKLSYEAEVKEKDVIFDQFGNFIKAEK
jgi:Putative beta-lactamase-inhibitor-like, PepSY-like